MKDKINVFGVVAGGLFASVDLKHSFNHCNTHRWRNG